MLLVNGALRVLEAGRNVNVNAGQQHKGLHEDRSRTGGGARGGPGAGPEAWQEAEPEARPEATHHPVARLSFFSIF